MATEIKLPELAEDVTKGEIVSVLVNVGDEITEDTVLVEVEAGKATLPIPANQSGKVTKVLVKNGDSVNVGEPIVEIEGAGGATAEEKPKEEPATAKAPAKSAKKADAPKAAAKSSSAGAAGQPTTIKLPELAEGVTKGDIVAVLVSEGDEVSEDTVLVEVESEKATLPVPANTKGKITKVLVKNGDSVNVGEALVELQGGGTSDADQLEKAAEKQDALATGKTRDNGSEVSQEELKEGMAITEEPLEGQSADDRPAPATHQRRPGEVIPAGPTVRRIAREIGIDLGIVQGSGRNGRISVEDLDPYIKGYVAKRGGGVAAGAGTSIAPIELPDFSKFGPIRKEKADSLRRKIAEKMNQSWSTVPHVHQYADADVTDLMQLLKRYKDRVKDQGGALTFTVFALKAAALALQEFPQMNCSYDAANQEIIFKDYIHIGVAVDTPAGLIVPVIRDVNKKSLVELSKELAELAEKTRDRKTSMDDLRGGTFTISNLGGIGGTYFSPIINTPEVAIMGIGRAQKLPRFDKAGNVVARDICPLCIAYDHRVIDGADGARFTARIVDILQNFEGAFLGF